MDPFRNRPKFWLLTVALAAAVSFGALKSKPPLDFPENGATLDVSAWSFRKSVAIVRPGAQQLELDLDVLGGSERNSDDLRLMRGNEEVPYVAETASITRALTPVVEVTNQLSSPTFTVWTLKLPKPNLPITRLTCAARTPLFQRDMTIYELVTDERGETLRHILSAYNTTWTQTPDFKNREFALELSDSPRTDLLFLETQNRDNPPIQLENIQLFYSTKRVLFSAKTGDELFLYYGNPAARSPHYDLSLIAKELLAADKATASLGAEELQNKATYRVKNVSGKGGVIFWGILAVVVVALLVVIARLLPKSDSQPPK
jgi:hypothetical protein